MVHLGWICNCPILRRCYNTNDQLITDRRRKSWWSTLLIVNFAFPVKSEALEDEGEEWQLKQSFNVRDHSGAIRCLSNGQMEVEGILFWNSRCVAAGSKFAISGGSDDSCKIYDMIERRELGTLQHHDVRCKINSEWNRKYTFCKIGLFWIFRE